MNWDINLGMLSYQHIYHAGNMADVQKHLWLLCVLEYLGRKDKPYVWIDTHAGRGAYDLSAPEAEKLGEYKSGIAALLDRIKSAEHPVLKLYAQKIAALNDGESAVQIYPGSSLLAAQMLRAGDKLFSYDLHPKEFEFLRENLKLYKGADARKEDGYAALKSLVPPQIRRGGVLIDPSYEIKGEYRQVASAVQDALKKWPQGVYMIWYPILAAGRHEGLCESLSEIAQSAGVDYTRDEWIFAGATKGMLGSGMAIVNTPYSCADTMAAIKTILVP
jgi:23S rRNA (adenine2030-N6)-methyltransferase